MTNDEAIYTLKNTAFLGWSEQAEKVSEAVRMAVEALQRETSGDAISRHDAIDALMEILDRPNHAEFLYTDEICKVLNELPSVQSGIIHCKDCRYFKSTTSIHGECECGEMWQSLFGETTEVEAINVHKDHYCGYAERRTDGRD